jgi:hypothetical protein
VTLHVPFALLASLLILAVEPTEEQKNAKIQADLAQTYYKGMMSSYNNSADQPFDIEKFSLWSWRWASAQRDASEKKEGRIAALQAHVDRMKELERQTRSKVKSNLVPRYEAAAAEYHRREAERQLVKEKAK